jgi:hypothetical protein
MSRFTWLALAALAGCTHFNEFTFSDGGGGSGGGDAGGKVGDMLPPPPDLSPCPSIFGRYSIQQSGDCNDLDDKSPECAAMTTSACFVHLNSAPLAMTPAVNGGVTLDSAGHFSGSLILGTVTRTNCMGTFDANTNKLTIICDAGTGNQCTLVLTRTANMCG